jgi:hypothetical protein
MLPVAKGLDGRALVAAALAAGALGFGAFAAAAALRVDEVTERPPSTVSAPWVDRCATRMERVRLHLAEAVPELARAEVQQVWSLHAAWAELRLAPQYAARIEYRPGEEAPAVFDWEEAPTPVAGSFALHRHIGHFDLTVVADDSDDHGLAFAARMQPLLDACVMEAEE